MTDKLKGFLERHNYKITAVNTLLIIIGISIGFWQRRMIEQKSDFSLENQDLMIKADSERMKKEDSIQIHLRTKLDSINNKK